MIADRSVMTTCWSPNFREKKGGGGGGGALNGDRAIIQENTVFWTGSALKNSFLDKQIFQ